MHVTRSTFETQSMRRHLVSVGREQDRDPLWYRAHSTVLIHDLPNSVTPLGMLRGIRKMSLLKSLCIVPSLLLVALVGMALAVSAVTDLEDEASLDEALDVLK